MIGQRVGLLTVISFSHKNARGNFWEVVCECGEKKTVSTGDLNSGRVKSCGCLRKKNTSQRFKKHGQSHTRLYSIWCDIKKRCGNDHPDYGLRGIKICKEWEEDFLAFYRDMGKSYQEGYSIERVNPNGDYEKENCVWIPLKDQAYNRTLQRNNKTGVAGVYWREDHQSFVATWADESGSHSCSYSVNKYGLEAARNLAIEKRVREITSLIEKGFPYASTHGVDKNERI